ncbi:MAG: monovalent cation/H+ antiporter subunit D family protein [Desulfobacteraceae bacterium]|nr:monovalent cation/H+ antiporter subunit D family protein [Desulfobacteraceae bacterium]
MTSQIPALIIVVPLLVSLVVSLAAWIRQSLCYAAALCAMLVAWISAILVMGRVINQGVITYRMAGWAPPWGISWHIDHFNAIILILIATVALINLIATRSTAAREFEDRPGVFYALYLLFVTGLMGIVITGDIFNLYVLLEIASLSGYALLGMGSGRAAVSSLSYLFIGTIGASLYLFGAGYLYIATGSLNMADIAAILPTIEQTGVIQVSFILCLIGLFMKMAFFPLHTWLPNAYTHAPNSSASLIAPLTTKVMIYVMIRIVLFVYQPEFAFAEMDIDRVIVWLAVIAILAGSMLAWKQERLKRMLAYIIVAEVGYMVGGFWLGNTAGMTGAVLHILNDAMMTLCLFLAAGAVISRVQTDAFGALQGVFTKMPFSMIAFVAGALSIIGVPPTCGFFSKWYLISGGMEAGHYAFVAALIISSLVNVLLFFRVIEIGYFEPFDSHHHKNGQTVREAPLDMLVPLLVTAGLLIVMGFYANTLVTWIVKPAISAATMGGL